VSENELHSAEKNSGYPDHWVRKPWPENRYPTVDEWIDWFLTAPRDQQYAETAMALADTQRAMRCLMLHPQPPRPTDARVVTPPGKRDDQ
jgi:hypothetical protein